MFSLIMLASCVVLMAKVADIENRSVILWGVITLLLCLGAGFVIPSGLLANFVGVVVAFGAMMLAKMISRD